MNRTAIGHEEMASVIAVLQNGELCRSLGDDMVSRFETGVARHFGVKYTYAVNSGTSANEACIVGLGLQPGDEVLCPATAPIFVSMAVIAAGCIPVFVDVDCRTLIIAPAAIRARINERTKAVVVVHLGGQPAPMDEILVVARECGLKVIEDCAQAFDCRYRGARVGTLGDVSCFSLQQSKHITAGEGGFILTNDAEVYKRAVLYSNAGMPWYGYGLFAPRPEPVDGLLTRGHFAFGHNHRMSCLHAAVALAQLQKIDRFNIKRARLAEMLDSELAGCPGILPRTRYPDTEAYPWACVVQTDPACVRASAAEVARLCAAEGGPGPIPYCEINYLEQVFRDAEAQRRTPLGIPLPDHVRYVPGSCPSAEAAAKRSLCFFTHHASDPAGLCAAARNLRKVMERLARTP